MFLASTTNGYDVLALAIVAVAIVAALYITHRP